MGDKTAIEWTDATWNPVRGCSRVSAGCMRCYAERVAARFSGPGQPYEGLALTTLHTLGEDDEDARLEPRWTGVVRMVPEHLADPLRWRRPRRIFVNSMSDLFHEKLADEEIAAVFGIMAASPRHTFQVLTKRAQRMCEWFKWVENEPELGCGAIDRCITAADENLSLVDLEVLGRQVVTKVWPLPNVWLGVSVENQKYADERLPSLMETPAAVRFASYEPALGPVDFRRWLPAYEIHGGLDSTSVPTLDWIIYGDESGPRARPADPAWARDVRDQCEPAGTKFFFKQRVTAGKKVKLPLLDGRQWAEYPE